MKKLYFLLFTLLFTSLSFGQDLIITGVYDGPLTGGTPKGIELYVVNNIADLSIYGVGSANNGQGTDGEEFTFPADPATAGNYIYVASEDVQFPNFFGFAPDYNAGSAMAINGDDAVELFMNGAVIDIFGDINVDGSGEPWDHLDGWAYRVNGTGPDGSTFVLANWTFSGIDVFDGETTNASATTPIPIGTYSTTGSTEPSLTINSPSEGAILPSSASTSLDVIFSIQNFTVATAGNGDGHIHYTVDGGSTVMKFDTDPITLTGLAAGAHAVYIELVDDSHTPISPAVNQTVNFSIELPCDVSLGASAAVCDATTAGVDTYTATVDFTGGNTGITYTVSSTSGTVSGDDPSTTATGTITVTGINEGTDITVTVVGGTGSSCDLTRNISSPVCVPTICASIGDIIITEIMQNPSAVGDDVGEWFEVYNTTGTPIDLQGWTLNDSSSSSETHTISTSVIVPTGGYAVIGNNSDTGTNGGVTLDYSYGGGYFLGNGTDDVLVDCNGITIDVVLWDNGSTFPDPNGASMELATNKYNATDNDDGTNWQVAVSAYGDGDLGTPGATNDFTLRVERNAIPGFNMYPNPVTEGRLTINTFSNADKKIQIFDILGKQVLKTNLSGKELNVSNLYSGIYILKILEEGKTATRKLVIK